MYPLNHKSGTGTFNDYYPLLRYSANFPDVPALLSLLCYRVLTTKQLANLLTRYPSPDYPKKGVDVPYLPVGYLSVRWYRTFTPAARVFSSMILLISSLPRHGQQWIILVAIKDINIQ